MNETTKAIVELLCEGKPELQVAAAQVLGELRPKDAAAIEALGDGPDRSPVLGRFCLDALAKIGSAAALGKLAEAEPLLRNAGIERAADLLQLDANDLAALGMPVELQYKLFGTYTQEHEVEADEFAGPAPAGSPSSRPR